VIRRLELAFNLDYKPAKEKRKEKMLDKLAEGGLLLDLENCYSMITN
jgi:hypothetical protein